MLAHSIAILSAMTPMRRNIIQVSGTKSPVGAGGLGFDGAAELSTFTRKL
jgi:hypothetical protein